MNGSLVPAPLGASSSFNAAFNRRTGGAWIAAGAGLLVVGADLFASWYWTSVQNNPGALSTLRAWLFVGCSFVFAWLTGWDLHALGLRLRPAQTWGYWLKASLVLGAIVSGVVGIFLVALPILGKPIPWAAMAKKPEQMASFFVTACIMAPLTEEGIYRFALCLPAARLFGRWPTIVLSGVVFAALHVLYGRPSPDNLVAGFVLGWALLKSESLLIPVILHALGNLCVLIAGLVVYQMLQ